MLTSVLLLMAQAGAPPPAPAPADEILVIGQRIEEELAACIARGCPPAEEIELSLQLSANQFAEGRYRDARTTLQRAIRRNRDHAAELPGPVSSMYATLATVAEHEGDPNLWRQSARTNMEVLRRHVGESHDATLRQELVFGDSMVRQDAYSIATDAFRAVQRKAAESGNTQLAANALFRRAWLELVQRKDRDALRLADEAVALAGPHDAVSAEMREIMRMQIAARDGDDGAIDVLAERLRRSATRAPVALFAPPFDDINQALNLMPNLGNDAELRFADVGFWVRPDGRTANVAVLRDSGLGQWAPGILNQIGRRRYIPLDVQVGHPGVYRIERFTVRGTSSMVVGSRIKRRAGPLTIHVSDLTETDAMNEAHRQRMQDGSAAPAGAAAADLL